MSETLNGKVPVFEELVAMQRQFIHGDDATVIETDNGPVPSIAKALKDGLGGAEESASASAAAAEATRIAYEDRVYPGIYSSLPTAKPHSGAPCASGDTCTALVGAVAYVHRFLGGGWLIQDTDGTDFQIKTDPAKGAKLLGLFDKIAPAYLKTVSDILNHTPVSILRFVHDSQHEVILDRTTTLDHRPNIQEATDAMWYSAGGGHLQIPRGRLRTGGPLLMKPKVSYIGENDLFGSGTSQIAPMIGMAHPIFVNDRTVGDYVAIGDDGLPQRMMGMEFRNLSIQATTPGVLSRKQTPVLMAGAWCIGFHNVRFGAGSGFAIDARDCNALTVERCFLSGGFFGDSLADSIFTTCQIGPTDRPEIDADLHNVIMWITGPKAWKNVVGNSIIYNCPKGVRYKMMLTPGDQNISVPGHNFIDETPVVLEVDAGTTIAAGLIGALTATAWVKVVDENTIKLASSRANFYALSYLTPTSPGSGDHFLRVGGPANLFLNNGASRNTFGITRFDQSYHHGVMFADTYNNSLTGCPIHENGRNNPVGQYGIRLLLSDSDTFNGNPIDGRTTATATGQPNQIEGIHISPTCSKVKLAGNSVVNHSSMNVNDLSPTTIFAERREVALPCNAWEPVGTGTPVLAALAGNRKKVMSFSDSASAEDIIQIWWTPPKGYTKWDYKFRWCAMAAGVGNVVWVIQYQEEGAGDDLSANEVNSATIVQAASGVGTECEYVSTARLSLSGTGKLVSLRLKRVGTNALDTLDGVRAGFVDLVLNSHE